MTKLVKMGCGFVRDRNWNPIKRNREQVERLAKKKAKQKSKKDRILWKGMVFEADDYFRINIGR